ncbi:CDP-diacylglycerol--glycerol-3-phosphate 3-phosphatidyltransferase [Heliophilum fasciatum]|uniref:CDP-diacylglycerol--glycerol-3-phosphate 3-phosphatidyltransferase n=1 Tax=Heliophilum fasciatum TaxID=35700 RepID=A0A4R2RI79_9FIRM|nr:CDP-diacylglycerol--glycerol-3-phosphate 3-phosphatidyltransferase [Heliophilum fasciatum]MCW2278515.1 CDP-diacylglycerol--glycerol-3-phosphate 3-phosphatidyltransferase [Heliophilum fasciatum]TCP63470.1 CDP-diacylglycerol--glycerol-3-phosphate 3-phosphatidyltransferase [Heliophilum fasciatum]
MNLANKITLTRVLFVPLFMVILLIPGIPYRQYLAAAVFILAASTDGLDGYIARSRKQITRFGTFLDPLADKLLISAALISLVELGDIPAWIAVTIVGREFAVTGLRSILATEGHTVSASKLGKLKTVFQIITVVVILIDEALSIVIPVRISQFILYLTVIFTLWSGIDYFIKAKPILQNRMDM